MVESLASVIVSTYNRYLQINQTVLSVIKETYSNLMVLFLVTFFLDMNGVM